MTSHITSSFFMKELIFKVRNFSTTLAKIPQEEKERKRANFDKSLLVQFQRIGKDASWHTSDIDDNLVLTYCLLLKLNKSSEFLLSHIYSVAGDDPKIAQSLSASISKENFPFFQSLFEKKPPLSSYYSAMLCFYSLYKSQFQPEEFKPFYDTAVKQPIKKQHLSLVMEHIAQTSAVVAPSMLSHFLNTQSGFTKEEMALCIKKMLSHKTFEDKGHLTSIVQAWLLSHKLEDSLSHKCGHTPGAQVGSYLDKSPSNKVITKAQSAKV